MTAIEVAIFPSAGSVHLYHAVDAGLFRAAGLEVTLHEVRSSDEQLAGWDDGRFDVLHTSPDHLLRAPRRRRAVVVRGESIGELTVYARPGIAPGRARWGVDGEASAFSLVLRSVVADCAGVDARSLDLVPVGGTKQRCESLLAGETDGATLHPPFDGVVAARGFTRVGGHLDVAPDLLTVCAAVEPASAASSPYRSYVAVCDASARELARAGVGAAAAALVRRGWDEGVARAAVTGLSTHLTVEPERWQAGLEAAAGLRRRWFPTWNPAVPLESLIDRAG